MKTMLGRAITVTLALAVPSAHAANIDFIAMADGAYGESAWTSLNLSVDGVGLSIKGYAGPNRALAYLDSDNAGLGVCKDAIGAVDVKHAFDKTNRCASASDDNVNTTEWLSFTFDKDITIDSLWFNNNHDGPGFAAGAKVDIDGALYNLDDQIGIGAFAVNAGEEFLVSYYNHQFYVGSLEFSKVPEPATLALLGAGLVGLGFRRRPRS